MLTGKKWRGRYSAQWNRPRVAIQAKPKEKSPIANSLLIYIKRVAAQEQYGRFGVSCICLRGAGRRVSDET
jgi:hypothetical protein